LLMAWILRGGWKKAAADEELRAYGSILFAAIALVTLDLVWHAGEEFTRGLQLASFQVVSIMTTTGFATADFAVWPQFSQAALVLLMFAGGCAGSTSGGIKISRIVIFFKAARQQILASFRPSQHLPVKFNARPLEERHVSRVLFFVALTGVVVGLSTLALAALEPSGELVGTFTAVVASLFNIGPGLGGVGPTKTYAHFSDGAKLFLAALMVVGRLEFFGILALFVPSLWKKY
jgi:trk system potassium uptake protein